MSELTGKVGFASPISEKKAFTKRRNAGVELMATVALAVSLVIAVTAVSFGMARAHVLRADSVLRADDGATRDLTRDSPDEPRTDVNICAFPAFPQDRRAVPTAAPFHAPDGSRAA